MTTQAATESVARVRGVELFVRRIGTGAPVVVLHGGPGAHHDYLLPGFDALAEGRELIYYDQRGGGRSPVQRDVPVGWTEHVGVMRGLVEGRIRLGDWKQRLLEDPTRLTEAYIARGQAQEQWAQASTRAH